MSRFSIIPAKAVTDDDLMNHEIRVFCAIGALPSYEDGWTIGLRSLEVLAEGVGLSEGCVEKAALNLVYRGYLEMRTKDEYTSFKILFDGSSEGGGE